MAGSPLALAQVDCQPIDTTFWKDPRVPTYEYRCDSCAQNFDVVQSFTDDPLTECPTCGSPVRKVFGSVGIVFKGSGFYKTDSRSGGSSAAGGSSSAPGEPSSGDSGTEKKESGTPSKESGTKESGTPSKESGTKESGGSPPDKAPSSKPAAAAAPASGGTST